MKYFLIYLLIINILTFLIYGLDKCKARKNKYRVSEKDLILLAIIGGSIGALLGIKVFHHKTLHKKFSIGIPLILLIQIILVVYLYISK